VEAAGGGRAGEAVAKLQQLDSVKRRMEDARSTLKVGKPAGLGRGLGASGVGLAAVTAGMHCDCM
jgi:hypothetical protein